jgi:hypothetical protein
MPESVTHVPAPPVTHVSALCISIPVPILGAGHYYLSQIFIDGLEKPQHFVQLHVVT